MANWLGLVIVRDPTLSCTRSVTAEERRAKPIHILAGFDTEPETDGIIADALFEILRQKARLHA
jgi:hypothetical protein